jgi:hypothetical protein
MQRPLLKDHWATDGQWASYATHPGWYPDASSGTLWGFRDSVSAGSKSQAVKIVVADVEKIHEWDRMHPEGKKEEVR